MATSTYGSIKIEGYGSVVLLEDKEVRLCRKWRLRPKSYKDLRTGKRVFPSEEWFSGTYTQATDRLKILSSSLDSQAASTEKKKIKTVGELAKAWFEEQALSDAKAQRTLEKYQTHINILNHHLEYALVKQVTYKHIMKMFHDCRRGDCPSGKDLSDTYLRGVFVTFNMLFKWGLKQGYCPTNPMVEVSKPKVDTKEKRALKPREVSTLKQRLDPSNIADVICAIALEAGYRRSEIALSVWKHVDLIEGEALVPGTKTEASFALAPLSSFLVAFLLEWKEYQRKQLAEFQVEQTEDTPIISNWMGHPFAPNSISRLWRERRTELGLPDFGLHELRHTFSTSLARKKVSPRIIQELMRHADTRMAQETYTHVDLDDMRWAVDLLDV